MERCHGLSTLHGPCPEMQILSTNACHCHCCYSQSHVSLPFFGRRFLSILEDVNFCRARFETYLSPDICVEPALLYSMLISFTRTGGFEESPPFFCVSSERRLHPAPFDASWTQIKNINSCRDPSVLIFLMP